MGDGICAYFGVPLAHEDDPERAARSGLRIIAVAAEYASEVEAAWAITGFNVRVGLNSGPAAVGIVGGGDPQMVALGDTTNVAARLQSAAEPGTIAVGPGTAERLAEQFVLEPLGDISVKGRAGAVPASRLVGPRAVAEPRPATPIVGREPELARLASAVADLDTGRGQVLLVVGDAGLGKTRMLAELRERVGEHATWLEGRCASYGSETPYGPFLDLLRTWLGATEGEAELAVRTKLRARAGALLGPLQDQVLPYLGLMLSVRMDPDLERELLSLAADELAGRIRDAYLTWVEALSSKRPLVLAIDDLHWADHTTRELAERLLPLTERAAVLLVTTIRPDPASEGWAFRLATQGQWSHRTIEVPLLPLSAEASGSLIDALVPSGILTEPVKDELIAKSEGNPLFLEELLRAVLESGGDRRRTWTITPGVAADLPPALEALLVSRIDRLGAGPRRLAQVAAVIGREFPVSVAARVAESTGADADIAVLLRADVVRELRRFPELECTFRHGLLQDAALSTLTSSALRELYGRVAHAMQERYADSAEERLEQLAFYYYRSDEQPRALEFLERAAARAESQDGFARAQELLTRAHRLADRMQDADAVSRIDGRLAALAARGSGEHPLP